MPGATFVGVALYDGGGASDDIALGMVELLRWWEDQLCVGEAACSTAIRQLA